MDGWPLRYAKKMSQNERSDPIDIMRNIFYLATFILLLASNVMAMRPAPFRETDNIDKKQDAYHLKSMHKGTDGYSRDGLTYVLDKKGKELWLSPFLLEEEAITFPKMAKQWCSMVVIITTQWCRPEMTLLLLKFFTWENR